MANPFCHMELQTDDVDKARGFYSELFDWEVEELPMGEFTYTMMKPNVGDPQVMGGITPKQAPDAPNHWLSYIAVEDVDATLAKARDLGGNVLADKMEIPENGWMGVVQDPTGAVFGLWQAMEDAS